MIRSMTAFGRARVTTEEKDITVEIKSVNSRYLDCTVRMPRRYGFLEDRVKTYAQQNGISRGKVEIYIGVDTLADTEVEILLDDAYAGGYIKALETLRDKFGLRDDISVMTVAQNREIFTTKRAEDDEEGDWQMIREVLDKALAEFVAVRAAEGEKIEKDISAKIEGIRETASKIAGYSEEEIKAYNAKLTERIKQFLGDNNIDIDESRVLTESAI